MPNPQPDVIDDLLDDIAEDERTEIMQRVRDPLNDERMTAMTKAANANAVQREKKPTINAIGPSTSMAAAAASTSALQAGRNEFDVQRSSKLPGAKTFGSV